MISRTKIDDMLYKLHIAAESIGDCYAIWGEYAIRSYILTGRASIPWIESLMRANPNKLLARFVKFEIGSDVEVLKETNEYLSRYCGLMGSK